MPKGLPPLVAVGPSLTMNPTRLRRLRRLPAILGLGLVTSAILLGQSPVPALALPTAPSIATAHSIVRADAVAGLKITVAPGAGGVLVPGTDLPVTVALVNTGETPVAAGTVRITLKGQTLTSRNDLSTFLAKGDGPVSTRGDIAVEVVSAELAPGASEVVTGVLPVAAVDLGTWGVHGVDASVYIGDSLAAWGRNSIVWNEGAAPGTARIALAVPITVGPSGSGLIPSATLDSLTSAGGLLTRQLDALQNRPVAIMIDPRIIASVRVLGSTAPQTAVDWLNRLAGVTNPVYPLGYADSDLAAEAQVGAGQVLTPISLTYSLDPAHFTSVTPTPAPTPAGMTVALPDNAALTAWDYASTSIAWPRANTVVAGALPFFAAAGLTQTMVSGSNLPADPATEAGYAGVVSSGADSILVSDPLVSQALAASASAGTATERAGALAQLAASLAVVAEEQPGAGAVILASLDRQWVRTPNSLSDAIDSLAGLGWAATTPFPEFSGQTPNAETAVVDAPENAERLGHIATLLAEEANLTAFSSVMSSPEVLTAPTRANLLALLDNSWVTDATGWAAALAASTDATNKTLQSVSIVPGSPITLAGNSANLPVLVQNGLSSPVTVILRVVPSNGRLIVDNEVSVTIPANANKQALVPVRAGVANGDVLVRVELVSPTGVLISGAPTFIPVTVSADWEVAGSWLVGSLVGALLIFAVVRIVRRRRHDSGASSAEAPSVTNV
jgi:hypothetical protein